MTIASCEWYLTLSAALYRSAKIPSWTRSLDEAHVEMLGEVSLTGLDLDNLTGQHSFTHHTVRMHKDLNIASCIVVTSSLSQALFSSRKLT